ncbi:MAG TPA: hypothetical protein G4O15_00630 [Dehalococcoidia bacterium]|nr:hypothetical protein [Dehalococcoidia bacterium]
MKKKIPALLVTLATVSLLVFSSPISAKGGDNPTKEEKSGYGYGDIKREHYGPPGHNDTNARPGWGYGDQNHYHYGYGYKYKGDK